jgi:hypothetical protein
MLSVLTTHKKENNCEVMDMLICLIVMIAVYMYIKTLSYTQYTYKFYLSIIIQQN